MPDVSAGATFGPYTLVERLGRGGMGEAWRAVWVGPGGVVKQLVIKRILKSRAAEQRFREGFIQEARLSAWLSHGNIAQVFDFGEIAGEYFMAMEYVHGRSLLAVLERAEQLGFPRLPLPIALCIAIEMLKGLEHAHTRRDDQGRPLEIVHRDISPDNVMVSFEGEVKLVDFGVARARLEGRPETLPGIVKGKLLYLSPQQAAAEPLDARSDLFATGLVLYRMLTGQQPVDDRSDAVVLHRLLRADIQPVGAAAPWLAPEIAESVMRVLKLRPEDRYPSAQAFGDALSAQLHRRAPGTTQTALAGTMALLFSPELKGQGRELPVPSEVRGLFESLGSTPRSRSPSPEPEPPRATSGARALGGSRSVVGALMVLCAIVGAATVFVFYQPHAVVKPQGQGEVDASGRDAGITLAASALEIGDGLDGGNDGPQSRAAFERVRYDAWVVACEEKSPDACIKVGHFHQERRNQLGIGREDFAATGYFMRACSLGSAQGCLLGARNEVVRWGPKREGIPQLYQQACRLGAIEACTEKPGSTLRPSSAGDGGDDQLYQPSCPCAEHDAAGCFRVGYGLEGSATTPADFDQARQCYQLAAYGGYFAGFQAAGALALDGLAGPRNEAYAVMMFRSGCLEGDGESCAFVGTISRLGIGSARSDSEAWEHFEEACRLGSLYGCLNVVSALSYGEGVAKDSRRAWQLKRHTCARGYTRACLPTAP